MPLPAVAAASSTPTYQAAEAVEVIGWDHRDDVVAVGDLGGGVAILEGPELRLQQHLERHDGGVTTVAWHPRRCLLATGGVDGVVRLHDGRHAAAAVPVGGPVRATRWSPAGDLLAVAAGNGVWVVDADGAHVAAAPLLAGAVHDAAWVPGGPAPIAVAGRAGIAWFGPGVGPDPVETWEVTGAARVVATDPRRERLASGDLAGVLWVVCPASGDELVVSGWRDRIERLAWCPRGRWLAVPDGDEVVAWHLDGIVLVENDPRRFPGHDDEVTDVTFVGDGLVSGSLDGTVAWWPADPLAEPRAHDVGAPVTRLAASDRGVVVGTHDGRVLLLGSDGLGSGADR